MPRSVRLTTTGSGRLAHYHGLLFGPDAAARVLLRGAAGFVGEHPFLGAAAARAALAADFLEARAFRSRLAGSARFDFVEEKLPGEEPIEALLSRGLAFDPYAGRPVEEHHTSGGFVV